MLLPDGLRVTRSLRRSARGYLTTVDAAFDAVIERCSDPTRPHGWIDDDIIEAGFEISWADWSAENAQARDLAAQRAIDHGQARYRENQYDGVIADHRNAIEEAGKLDPVTEDILTGQTGDLEQFQWFLRSFLTNAAGELSTAGEHTEKGAAKKGAAKKS